MLRQIRSALGRFGRTGPAAGTPADLRVVFQNFKKVLDDNSEALGIITDMGEKMGGSFLFDATYVRRSYAGLAAGMLASLDDFHQLTGHRYPGLDDAFGRIDNSILAAIASTAPAAGPAAVPFVEITPGLARAVGGKNFHLADLKNNLGVPVPAGFAMTIAAFDAFVAHNGLRDDIAGLGEGEPDPARLEDLRGRILAGSLPPALAGELEAALGRLRQECGEGCLLAVRSSAEAEDGYHSFAGQFETVLNVPARPEAVLDAYRRVLASLFTEDVVTYSRGLGYPPGGLRMAAGFVAMVDAAASGVVYTVDPRTGSRETMMVSAAWGLGKSVVEGEVDADVFVVAKEAPFSAVSIRVGGKETMTVARPEGGVEVMDTPASLRSRPSLAPEALAEVARLALAIEDYYRRPQDIEWALDREGRVVILQARPLRIPPKPGVAAGARRGKAAARPVLLRDQGFVVQPGAVSGPVFVAEFPEAVSEFPRGAILVAPHDSPKFVQVMPLAAAIITDTGNPTSHMASISREFRVPTVVGAAEATSVLKPGAVITLDADEEGAVTVYEGEAHEVLDEHRDSYLKLEELYEYRRRKYIMRLIAPLNLTDPLSEEFIPENCRTLHDILRFIHEKAVEELISSSQHISAASARGLKLPVPESIRVVDLGGGAEPGAGDPLEPAMIASVPFRALLEGMADPEAWDTRAVPVKLSDFFSAMTRSGEPLKETGAGAQNLAVISRRYMNLSLRFGYHFNVVDGFVSERTTDNYIYFRFLGGATDITKRQRRVRLIEDVLTRNGFSCRASGDLIEARVSHIEQPEALRLMVLIGRLIAFTRQLDTAMNSDSMIEELSRRFRKGEPRP